MHAHLYLQASKEPEASLWREKRLTEFAWEHQLGIVCRHQEEGRGRAKRRPALFHLIEEAAPGDILLMESIVLLTQLAGDDWDRLRKELSAREVRLVLRDVPSSWPSAVRLGESVGTAPAGNVATALILDVLEVSVRWPESFQRARRKEVAARIKAANPIHYRGRPENKERNAKISEMLRRKVPWSKIMKETRASRHTLAKLTQRLGNEEFREQKDWQDWQLSEFDIQNHRAWRKERLAQEQREERRKQMFGPRENWPDFNDDWIHDRKLTLRRPNFGSTKFK